jgi:hypothetical protein
MVRNADHYSMHNTNTHTQYIHLFIYRTNSGTLERNEGNDSGKLSLTDEDWLRHPTTNGRNSRTGIRCKYRMPIIRFISFAADVVLATTRRNVFPSSSTAVRVSKINIMYVRRQFCELTWNTHLGDGTHFSESVEVNPMFLAQAVSISGLSNFSCNHDLYLSKTFPAFISLLVQYIQDTG